MSLKSYRDDMTRSISPILGPLSGGSWMTLSPLAALRTLSGSGPIVKKESAKFSKASGIDSTDPVEVIRIPLNDKIIMEIKSYSKEDLLMTWELGDLKDFIESSLRAHEVFDPDIDSRSMLADLYEFYPIKNNDQKGSDR